MNLAEMAGGGLAERVDLEVKKVLANIMDPNTDAKKARKLVVTFNFKADENRDIADVSIETKTTLAPAKGLITKIAMGVSGTGETVAQELQQMKLFDDTPYKESEVPTDTNVSYLERKQAGRV
ncbi:replication terminator protein [Alicyclobacillus fastidiosus]|uniref:Replication terminator protein n=1 Tax=Alicyclobacillus fastidiosus TaxID=392011 RepID=A0ABV5A9T1_9BACL|nr:replication terminator protein [Alicyclobacillus fastidiosus]WEH10952.1 replication terminator protein [Alicyclobacillus fastidiosus]